MKRNQHISNIHSEDPNQEGEQEIEETPLDQGDFKDVDVKSFMEEEERGSEEPEPTEEEQEEERPNEEPEDKEDKQGPTPEDQARVDDVKKDFVRSFIKADTLVSLSDMLMKRLGSFVPKSKKEEWALDDEEKEVITKLLDATITEEGIKFWPAKVWLGLSAVVIYGSKGMDVYQDHHSSSAKEMENNPETYAKKIKEIKSSAQLERDIVQAELEELKRTEAIKKQMFDIKMESKRMDTELNKEPKRRERPTVDPRYDEEFDKNDEVIPENRYFHDSQGNRTKNKNGSWRKVKGPLPGQDQPRAADGTYQSNDNEEDTYVEFKEVIEENEHEQS